MKRLFALAGILAALLICGVATASASGISGQVFTNDGTTFQKGVSQTFDGSYQNVCDKGDVFTMTGDRPYEDIGKVYWVGTLNDLLANGAVYQASNKVGANIWIDTNGNGTFFAWNGNVFTGLGGDDYGSLGAARNINGSTHVDALDSSATWTGVSKLSDLSAKLNGDTLVALWVGISGAPPQTGVVSSFNGTSLVQECPTPTPTPSSTPTPSGTPTPTTTTTVTAAPAGTTPGLPDTGFAPVHR